MLFPRTQSSFHRGLCLANPHQLDLELVVGAHLLGKRLAGGCESSHLGCKGARAIRQPPACALIASPTGKCSSVHRLRLGSSITVTPP